MELTRRNFARWSAAFATTAGGVLGAATLDATLGDSIQRNGIPAAAALAATPSNVRYHGAFGHRDSESQTPVTTQSIFSIASMTKPVTAVSAMQLVERGKLKLDDPVARYLPELEKLQVLEGFSPDGRPNLRPAAAPVLLRHLLTHTSGFAYDTWDAKQLRYSQFLEQSSTPRLRVMPLSFDPGTQWRYGTSMDWTGRLVEAISGISLEDWFQKDILQPLGMKDTSFILPESKFDRLVALYERDREGRLQERPRRMPAPPKSYNGGGGLYSTPEDYVRFMRMILRRGRGEGGTRILRSETVDLMTRIHTGTLSAGKLKTERPATSSDMDMHPGYTDGFGYGFLINSRNYAGGRSAGSLAWAGIDNTFFWIDPRKHTCAVIMMQFLPFCDAHAMAVLRDFEHRVYAKS